jgi:hypothetical protein
MRLKIDQNLAVDDVVIPNNINKLTEKKKFSLPLNMRDYNIHH